MSRIIVFGGTFDPVHAGHLALAEFAQEETGAPCVLLLPAARSPLRDEAGASFGQRVAMLRLATADTDFVVDEREGLRPAPSYTVDTLEELHAELARPLALLIGGLFAGQHYLAPKAVAPADDPARKELVALKAQVDTMGQLVTYSLLQQQTTSDRLQTVLAKMDLKSPDRKVLTDLVGALAFDPSINVRLSAVEVLAQHTDDSLVRAGVLSALPRERAPLVQVAMIELLADAREQNALPVFEKLSRDEALDINVRDAARRALASLRTPATRPETTNPSVTQTAPVKPVLT